MADQTDLLAAFRTHYYRFVELVNEATQSPTDPNILHRFGDQIDEYGQLIIQHSAIFEPPELALLQENVSALKTQIRVLYDEAISESHHGHPIVIETVHSGRRGRPAFHIDEDFLRWAYSMRSTSAISRFLGIGRRTVRNALLDYGIVEQQPNPFIHVEPAPDHDLPSNTPTPDLSLPPLTTSGDPDFLDASDPLLNPTELPPNSSNLPTTIPTEHTVSYTGPLSSMDDDTLDSLIQMLRCHYTRAGISILHGMLRRLGHNIPRSRIHESLLRIDPVQRVFERIRIRRRVYSVPGPNSLWHHDGQHGLIRWGIVIHGFIDGYSRLITALRASNNNTGDTVLDLFMQAIRVYGVPLRLRGDHGVENIKVAAWMEQFRGTARGSYIWGRSVHNVRIERLWVDITAQIGSAWAEAFTELELHYGLDINNRNHIWLLHYLFLPTLNQQLTFFAESWNHHKIQIRNGPNRSPLDMFGFDMLVHGIRGDSVLSDDNLSAEELEVYGIDWAAYNNEPILQSVRQHARDEPASSWVGQAGPPPNLNEVPLYPPPSPSHDDGFIAQLGIAAMGDGQNTDICGVWFRGLAFASTHLGENF